MVRASSLFVPLILTVTVSVFVSVLGCGTTQQARRVETSGFLKDYSQLQEGKQGEALLVYINPDADFSAYDKVLLDDVTVWRAVDSNLADAPEEEIEELALGLHEAMVESLKEDYEIVHTAGPGTLRVRVAITEAAKSWVVLDTLTTVVPHTRLISGIQRLATGTHSFVGKASIEGEILDAQSGERLAAAVDRRAGGKSFQGLMSSWDDVKEACHYWAGRLRDRLRAERGKADGTAVDGSGEGAQ